MFIRIYRRQDIRQTEATTVERPGATRSLTLTCQQTQARRIRLRQPSDGKTGAAWPR